MNVELLRQVQGKIRENPEKFNMDWWGGKSSCGTTACIGGWACHLAAPEQVKYNKIGKLVPVNGSPLTGISDLAAELLGIDSTTAEHLFYREEWPKHHQTAYWAAETDAARAEVACQVIEDLIRSNPAP